MKHFCQLKAKFNFQQIQKECIRLSRKAAVYHTELWQKSMQAVSLKSYSGQMHDFRALPGTKDFIPTEALLEAPYTNQFIKSLPGKTFSVRLMNLEGEKNLGRHVDYCIGLGYGVVRIHLPIVTDKKVIFHIEDEKLHLNEGTLWFTDIASYHSVANPIKKSRLHLIIDLCLDHNYLDLFPTSFIKKWEKENFPIIFFSDIQRIKKSILSGRYKIPYLFLPDPLKVFKTEEFQFRQEETLFMYPKGSKEGFPIYSDKNDDLVFPTLGPYFRLTHLKKEWLVKSVIKIDTTDADSVFDQKILFPLKSIRK